MLYERTHTRDLGLMGGLGATVPALAGVFLFVALSSIGLPGLNGFVGEFLILLGTFIRTKAMQQRVTLKQVGQQILDGALTPE